MLTLCDCFTIGKDTTPTFVLIVGTPGGVGLYVRVDSGVRPRRQRIYLAQKRAQNEPLQTVEQVTQAIKTGRLPAASLVKYFSLSSSAVKSRYRLFATDLW
jgi:hypothetical protein